MGWSRGRSVCTRRTLATNFLLLVTASVTAASTKLSSLFFSNAKAKMLEPDLRVNSQVSMPDGKNVAASEKEVEREMSRTKRRPDRMQATERAVKIQRFQGQTRSRESGIIRQDVKRKTCQGEIVPRDGTVNDRYRQVVRLCSYRLSLFFIAFAPSETSATRLARTLLV